MAASPDDQETLTRDDLRRLEARVQARLAEVAAWPVLDDGRFAAMTDRLDQADRRADSLAARLDSGLGTIADRVEGLGNRHDLLDTRLADLRTSTVALLRCYRTATTRATVVGIAAAIVLNAVISVVYVAFR